MCQQSKEKLIKQIQKTNKILNQIKNNPEMILTDIFHGQGCYNEVTDIIKTFGKEFTVHDFQKYIYSLLIPFLKEDLGEHYDFDFYENTYSSGLNIIYGKYSLATVDIYSETVRIWKPLHIESLEEDLETYKRKLENSQILLKQFEDAGMNPFKICNNPIDFFYFIFRFKTYRAKINYVIEKIKGDVRYYEEETINTEFRIREQKLIKDDIEKCTQEITDYFSRYRYKIHNI